uniref:MI domain-containing protein n=2 Tax=Lygus hesperus TaxID=30085 RepID=A0A0K8SYN4_LYGHE
MEDGEIREKKKCRKVSKGERERNDKRSHHKHKSHQKEDKHRHRDEDVVRIKEEDKPRIKEEDKPRHRDGDKTRQRDDGKSRHPEEDNARLKDEEETWEARAKRRQEHDEIKRRRRARPEDDGDVDVRRHKRKEERDENDEPSNKRDRTDRKEEADEDEPSSKRDRRAHKARDEEDEPSHKRDRTDHEEREKENEPSYKRDRKDRKEREKEDQRSNKRDRKDHKEREEEDEPSYERDWTDHNEWDDEDEPSFRQDRIAHKYEDSDEEEHFHHLPDDNRYWGGKRGAGVIMKEAADEDYMIGKRYYTEPKPDDAEEGSPPRSGRRAREPEREQEKPREATEAPKRKTMDTLMTRTGGAYIPPGKLRMMQASITDKSSAEYQRIAWEALKKSIHGHINKVNTSNIAVVARLLFKENIVRGRGLLCRSIIQAQAASPTFTNVYACLVSINSKFPNIGELLLKRVVIRFKRAYKRNDKVVCVSSATFIAHLINQRVAHEILGLELLTLLVESPTDDSVEVAVSFLKEAGQKLGEVSSKGSNAIFDMLRNILHEGKLDKRIQYMIEVMFQVRKDGFQSFPAVTEELDLVDEEDQFTHLVTFDDAEDPQDILNVFKMDTDYITNEDKYKALRSEILDTDGESGDSDGDDSDDESGEGSDEEDEEGDEEKKVTIVDQTETNLVALRKTIYLTIQSSLDFEECAHKLLRMDVKPGQEKEMCHMFLDCCAEQRTYEKFFGLLAQRFCQVNQTYVAPFEQIFMDSYNTVHRLDTNKLRNVAKFFGHLLFTDAISWAVFSIIKLNEEDTTSSSRIFIKILFQELAEYMGLTSLNTRLKDPSLQESMEGLFPRDDPKNTRFAINFFTSIGLGGLTDDLREHLKNLPKPVPISQLVQEVSSSSSSSSSESSSEEDSSSEESSDSEDDRKSKKKKGRNNSKQDDRGNKKKNAKEDEQSGSTGPDSRKQNRQATTREWDRGKEPIDDREDRRPRNDRPRRQDDEEVRGRGNREERFGGRQEDRSGGMREDKDRSGWREDRSSGRREEGKRADRQEDRRDERSRGRRDERSSGRSEDRGKEDRRRKRD